MSTRKDTDRSDKFMYAEGDLRITRASPSGETKVHGGPHGDGKHGDCGDDCEFKNMHEHSGCDGDCEYKSKHKHGDCGDDCELKGKQEAAAMLTAEYAAEVRAGG
jgi:hypothetical protein